MIVVCTNCHAKFRLADEKVGPRGIRIRCSKCQGVFEVRRPEPLPPEPPPVEPPPRELASPPPPPPNSLEVDLDDSGRARSGTPALSPPTTDPFATQAQPPAVAAVDPFAAAIGQVAPPTPFVQSDASEPSAPSPPPPSTADPFASLTLQLSSAPPPESVPRDDPFAASNSPPAEGEESAPPPSEEVSFTEVPVPLAGRENPPPLPRREPQPPLDDAPPPPSPFPPLDLVAPSPPEAPPAAEPPPSQPAPEAVAQPAEEKPAPAQRSGRPHTLLVNSISIAVLLALALGLFVYWRGEGHGPKILKVSGLIGQEEVGAVATQISSGLYQTFDGRSLLFVRGSVQIRTPIIPNRIRVRADLLQGEIVVATGESPIGVLPNPEELAAIAGAQDAERLLAVLEQRAPKQARVGDQLPFLVLFTEFPSDIGSIQFRVNTEAAATAAGN